MSSYGRILVAAGAVALALTACGGDEPAGTKGKGSAPVCSELWVAGNTVPAKYSGCAETADSGKVAAMAFQCKDGRQLTTYQDRMWAFIGEAVHDGGTESPGYQAAKTECAP